MEILTLHKSLDFLEQHLTLPTQFPLSILTACPRLGHGFAEPLSLLDLPLPLSLSLLNLLSSCFRLRFSLLRKSGFLLKRNGLRSALSGGA